MSNPIKTLPAGEIAKLVRIDDSYRGGKMQREVAAAEGVQIFALKHWMANRGFKFEMSRTHGPRVIAISDGATLQEWLKTGDLAAKQELSNAVR